MTQDSWAWRCGWGDERFILGREVGDVLGVEERLLLDESDAGEARACAERLIAAQVGVEFGQDHFVAADARQGVLVRRLPFRIERSLRVDQRESCGACLRREIVIGVVVRLGGVEEQRMVRRRLRVVRLGRFVARGAAAEGGEEQRGEQAVGEHQREAAGVLGDGAPWDKPEA